MQQSTTKLIEHNFIKTSMFRHNGSSGGIYIQLYYLNTLNTDYLNKYTS